MAFGPAPNARSAELPIMKSRLRMGNIVDPRLNLACCSGEYADISSELQFIPPGNISHFGRVERARRALHHADSLLTPTSPCHCGSAETSNGFGYTRTVGRIGPGTVADMPRDGNIIRLG